MLIDRAVAAYQDFIRISGWTGNTALMVEHEFFGRDRPCVRGSSWPRGAHDTGPHGRGVHQPAAAGPDPAGRAQRPGHARGAQKPGNAKRHPEQRGREIEAGQDLGDMRSMPAGLSTRAAMWRYLSEPDQGPGIVASEALAVPLWEPETLTHQGSSASACPQQGRVGDGRVEDRSRVEPGGRSTPVSSSS